jgi:maltooligosyltrehalose trehalohydrolase
MSSITTLVRTEITLTFFPTPISRNATRRIGERQSISTGPIPDQVREFFITNARYWIEEFHFDGFRLDATQSIFDKSEEHILAAIGKAARAAAGKRSIFLVAENEPQETRLIRPRSEGGYGLDGLWNDDFHHSAIVALTGKHPAYYTDYRGTPQEFIAAVKHGFLYQGQRYTWQKQRRGTSTHGLAPEAFVGFVENHDQVANSAAGERVRLTASPGCYRALLTLVLLAPWTPMLFQGQEFGATTPFLYFADVSDELREPVRKGRLKFLRQFPELASKKAQRRIADPSDPKTFQRCKLDFSERRKHPEIGRALPGPDPAAARGSQFLRAGARQSGRRGFGAARFCAPLFRLVRRRPAPGDQSREDFAA